MTPGEHVEGGCMFLLVEEWMDGAEDAIDLKSRGCNKPAEVDHGPGAQWCAEHARLMGGHLN